MTKQINTPQYNLSSCDTEDTEAHVSCQSKQAVCNSANNLFCYRSETHLWEKSSDMDGKRWLPLEANPDVSITTSVEKPFINVSSLIQQNAISFSHWNKSVQ